MKTKLRSNFKRATGTFKSKAAAIKYRVSELTGNLHFEGSYDGEQLQGFIWRGDKRQEIGGTNADRAWWTKCAENLGAGAVDHALGLLKESRSRGGIHNPGGLLSKIFKDIAKQQSIAIC